jgi:hypothetical protein
MTKTCDAILNLVEERNKLMPKDWRFTYNQNITGNLCLYYKDKLMLQLIARTEVELLAIPTFIENLKIYFPQVELYVAEKTLSKGVSDTVTQLIPNQPWQ